MNIDDLMKGSGTENTIEKITHYSFSSMNSVAICQGRWKASYIDKLRSPMGAPAKFGIAFEAKLAKELGFDISEEIKEGRILEEDVELVSKEVEIYKKYDKAWTRTEELGYQKKTTISPDKFVFLCKKYGLDIYIPHVEIIGYIDFIKRGQSIMDMKTTGRSGWKADHAYQLISYMLAEDLGYSELHQLVRTKVPKCNFYNLPLTDGNAREVLKWFSANAEIAMKIESGEIKPVNMCSWACSYCSADSCPTKLLNDVKAT